MSVWIFLFYPTDAENSTEKISEFASSNANSEIIKEMATKLDQIKSRVLKNWMDLGQQFKISGDKLKEIEYGQFNPALVLMEYLYSEQEHLTVGKFYEEVKNLKRGDVLKKLDPFLSGKFWWIFHYWSVRSTAPRGEKGDLHIERTGVLGASFRG